MPSVPNVVMILADDLGWSDLTCFGSSFYETPHIDALATTGVSFDQAYASAPVCSPSRASLMSGQYPARVGVTNWIGGAAVGLLDDVPYAHVLPENQYSLARALGEAGYQTWHVGKWHLGQGASSPTGHGFDVNIGGWERGSPSSYFSPYNIPTLPDGPDGEYLTYRLTDEATTLIREHDQQAPFFLNLWHYTVHTPLQAPDDLVAYYADKAQRLGLDTEPVVAGEPMPTWHLAGQRVMRRQYQSHPTYAAMVQTFDESVGAVVEALRDTGQLDNTVIIVTSDNGGLATAEGSPTCNAPLAEGKGWMDDGGVRVPLLISWPGEIPPDTRSSVVTTSPDLYVSIAQLAGATLPSSQVVDGVDILAAARGLAMERGPVFWHYPHYSNQGGTPGAAVRDGRWKLVRYFEDERCTLFDLDADPGESTDLAEAHPDVVADLRARLADWLVEVGARIPQPNPAGPVPWSARQP